MPSRSTRRAFQHFEKGATELGVRWGRVTLVVQDGKIHDAEVTQRLRASGKGDEEEVMTRFRVDAISGGG